MKGESESIAGAFIGFFTSLWYKGTLVAHAFTIEDVKSLIVSVLSALLGYSLIQVIKYLVIKLKK